MRALRILLRHRVTRWLRDPTWGTGTVAGQVVLLGFLLVLLAPLGLGSYVLGEVLRELYPEASALSLINGGMLYLVPVFMASRFLTQPPPSEHVAPYVSLPISGTGLLNGQAALSLLSLHTVFAVVLVGPVWAREIATAWTPVGAGAWLVAALLLTIVLASHGANLLHLLLGRRPWGTAGALAGIALFSRPTRRWAQTSCVDSPAFCLGGRPSGWPWQLALWAVRMLRCCGQCGHGWKWTGGRGGGREVPHADRLASIGGSSGHCPRAASWR